ncbi:unnamed protein product [marine sediment metagenome]|uniref:C-methyltransferase domain-containing protein n=1 Tax=marine sediment metagenome TaxID=412755 RepID=X0T4T1_9ZZZZ
MLRKVNTLLKEDGYVYVEVPDLYQIYPAIYSYFHHEHMSYFTPVSLENALRGSGFSIDILEQFVDNPGGTGKGYPVLRAIARKRLEVEGRRRNDYVSVMRVINDYQKALLSFQERVVKPLEREIESWIKKKRRVAIFGAGPHTMTLFEIEGIRKVNCVAIFDNNPRKWGLDIYGIPVHGPGDVASIGPDVVLISSREREDEIFAKIADWKSCGIDVVRIYQREHDSR